jgi:hypothetical protein
VRNYTHGYIVTFLQPIVYWRPIRAGPASWIHALVAGQGDASDHAP